MAVKLWKSRIVLRKCHLFTQCNACYNLVLRSSTGWEDTHFCIFYSGVYEILYWRLQVSLVHSALPLHLSSSPKTDFQRQFLLLFVASFNETCIAECQCCVSWEKNPIKSVLWVTFCGSVTCFLWCVCHEAGLCSPVKDAVDALLIARVFLGRWCLCELSVNTAGQHWCLNVFQALP